MKPIYVDDPSNANQVVAALQQALGEVLSPAAVVSFRDYPYECHNYKHVHPRGGGSAVASATLMKSSKDDPQWALFVHIFYGPNRPTPIPQAIAQRLRVGLRGTVHGDAFVADQLNRESRFYMRLPREVFIQNPSGVVTLV